MANILITEGDKIDFKDILSKEQLNGGLTPATYASQVFEIRNDDILRVSMPIEHGRIIPLSKGKKFDAFFYTAKGLYQCMVIIIDRFKINNIYMMDIELLTEPVKYQRRQYYRLELNIPVRYMQITETESNMMANGEELPERLGNLSEFYSGDTIDLSGGGLRFTGDGFVEKEIRLLLYLILIMKAISKDMYLLQMWLCHLPFRSITACMNTVLNSGIYQRKTVKCLLNIFFRKRERLEKTTGDQYGKKIFNY